MCRLSLRYIGFYAVACVACSGCGGAERLVPVSGRVTVDGAALTTGSVSYHPDTEKGNKTSHIPVGSLNAEGQYKLVTATKEGAPPGWYKVAVSAQDPSDPKNPYALPKHLINPKYSDPNTSELAIEVVANPSANAYDLTLAK